DLYGNRQKASYLIGSFQIDNCVDRKETFNLGLEYRFGVFFLRSGMQLGYTTGDEDRGMIVDLYGNPRPTFGAGWLVPISIAIMHVDWAYTEMGYLEESFLKSAHRLSIKMEF
ncbi:MAG: hypothetical protein K8S56_01130, partial [Candidatus Cloacimonetes bacterium]|nr:hypothetical protein [Candidatus Cloacimonadota bacterium]